MAIDFDFDDFDLKELNFEEPELMDCGYDDLLFDDDLELEFDDEDEFPMVNYEEGDEIDLLPKTKRLRTVWPCKK